MRCSPLLAEKVLRALAALGCHPPVTSLSSPGCSSCHCSTYRPLHTPTPRMWGHPLALQDKLSHLYSGKALQYPGLNSPSLSPSLQAP